MPVAYFETRLTLETAGGAARLVAPAALRELDHHILIARDGGDAIVRVEAPAKALEQVAAAEGTSRLTPKEAEKLRERYPPPRLKQRYVQAAPDAGGAAPFATDSEGNPVVETLQTVRVGFHLVDLALSAEES